METRQFPHRKMAVSHRETAIGMDFLSYWLK